MPLYLQILYLLNVSSEISHINYASKGRDSFTDGTSTRDTHLLCFFFPDHAKHSKWWWNSTSFTKVNLHNHKNVPRAMRLWSNCLKLKTLNSQLYQAISSLTIESWRFFVAQCYCNFTKMYQGKCIYCGQKIKRGTSQLYQAILVYRD